MKFGDFRAINKLIDPIRRQVRNTIARGIISLVDDTTPIQRVQVQVMALPQPDGSMGTETIPDLEVFQRYGFTSVPFGGAEMSMACVGGVRGHGLVITIDDRRYRPTGLTSGESQMYDDQGQKIYISRSGIVIEGAGLPVTVTKTPSVTLDTDEVICTKNLTVKGKITGQGGFDISGGDGATMRAQGNIAVTGGEVTVDGIGVKGHGHKENGTGSLTSKSVEL